MVPLKRHLVTLQFNVSVCGAENKTSTQTVITVISQSGRGHRASMGSRGCSEQPLCTQSQDSCALLKQLLSPTKAVAGSAWAT